MHIMDWDEIIESSKVEDELESLYRIHSEVVGDYVEANGCTEEDEGLGVTFVEDDIDTKDAGDELHDTVQFTYRFSSVALDGSSVEEPEESVYYGLYVYKDGEWVREDAGIIPEDVEVKDLDTSYKYGIVVANEWSDIIYPDKVYELELDGLSTGVDLYVIYEDGVVRGVDCWANGKGTYIEFDIDVEDDISDDIEVELEDEDKGVKEKSPVRILKADITSIQEEKERIVREGILTENQVDHRIAYMEACGVDEVRMLNVLKKIDHVADEVKDQVPKLKVIYQDSAGLVPKCIGYINIGSNLMFEGEKGVGKNVLSETLAWLYNRPLFEFPMNSQHTNSSIFGTNTFGTEEVKIEDKELKEITARLEKQIDIMLEDGVDDVDEMNLILDKLALLKSGNNVQLVDTIEFKPSAIVQALEYGGFLVLDEFNTGVPEVLSALNGMLDYRARLSVPGYGTVEAKEHFVAIGTQNKDYAGTTEQNKATTDRFTHILFPRRESLYDILITNYPDCEREIRIYDKLYKGMLDLVDERKLESSDISIRGFNTACAGLSQGMDMVELLEDNVVNKIENELSRQCVQVLVDSL